MSEPISEDTIVIGKRLQEIQIGLNYTSEAMAEGFGVSTEQYRKYCKGESNLNLARIMQFCEKTPFDVTYLATGIRSSKDFTVEISTMNPKERKERIDQMIEYLRRLSDMK